MLKIRGADKEVVMTNIRFTGNAIALLNEYVRTDNTIHLEDWQWHEELRSGTVCCIITDIKKSGGLTHG